TPATAASTTVATTTTTTRENGGISSSPKLRCRRAQRVGSLHIADGSDSNISHAGVQGFSLCSCRCDGPVAPVRLWAHRDRQTADISVETPTPTNAEKILYKCRTSLAILLSPGVIWVPLH